MPLLHIEHPEDSILTGDLDVLSWFTSAGRLSLKIDGSPAIVWGIDPSDGKFFVGTKSVFNKRIPKVIKSVQDLVKFGYEGELFDILWHCFRFLPRTEGIFQGDFIGFGGDSEYTPNTLTYKFKESLMENIIVAPHTQHVELLEDNTLRNTYPVPLKYDQLESTLYCKFIQPRAYSADSEYDYWNSDEGTEEFDLQELADFARQMSTLATFVDEKKAKEIKKVINTCIREEIEIDPEDFAELCDVNLIRLWVLVENMKLIALDACRYDDTLQTYLDDDRIDGEGFVFDNGFGTYKLVNRRCFSYYNFANSKNR